MNKNTSIILEDIFTSSAEQIYASDIVRQCFNIVGVLVVAIDVNGKITLINKKGCELLNLKEEEVEGKSFIDDFVVESQKQSARDLFSKILSGKTGYSVSYRYTLITSEHSKIIIEAKNIAIRKNQSEIVGFIISGEDVTKYHRVQQELQDSVNLYKLLANIIPDINMYLFDTDMRYVIVEGSEMKKFGFHKDYFRGKTLYDVLDEESREILVPLYKSALEGRELSTEFTYRKNNYIIWLFPLKNQDNEINGGIAITQNITADKLNSRKLKNAKEKAEEANNFKSEFIANVSHEIRTPLNAILGFTEQLSKTKLDAKQEGFVKIIDKSSEHLLALVNQILILSKIEAGQVQIDKAPFRLSTTVNEVYKTLNIKAKEKDLAFSLLIDSDVDCVLVGDAFRLKQILMNIVSNAIKFTEQGFVKILVSAARIGKTSITVQFDVIDTGIGINKDKLHLIFNQFRQADSAVTKRFGGSGLGLTISKKLLEIQNGDISVQSDVGKGTHFTFKIKYKKGNEQQLIDHSTVDEGHTIEHGLLKGKKVLLVDDDAVNRLLGKTILEELQCDVDIANDGHEAIAKVKENSYDVILLDIHMPDMSGFHVAKILRKELNLKTKIIAVSAAIIHKDEKRIIKSGINDYLIKPFKEANLYYKICKHLNLTSSRMVQTSEAIEEVVKHDAFDLTELETIAKGNTEFFVKMLDTFIKTTEENLAKIKRFQEDENWLQVGEVAHKMLPSVRHLKIKILIELLTEIKVLTLVKSEFDLVPELLEKAIKEAHIILSEIKNKKTEFLWN